MTGSDKKVAAVVLAAGSSRRMGRPKLVLPWENSTVIGNVIHVLTQADLDEILVVTGGASDLVGSALSAYEIRIINNPAFREGEMLSSAQAGISSVGAGINAALIVLGDQPFLELRVVQLIIGAYRTGENILVVPSYQMRRGHPWLVDKSLWWEILNLDTRKSLRDFLNANQRNIKYIEVDTNTILLDLDTPNDYLAHRPAQT